ncbi:MAG: class I SAM-dependent methyltransferase [Gemmataceae bacterium]|nr:class I SAM-dependent methyltransferase [Gemmataceae bacterium]
MERNWIHINEYLDRLARDVYPEPVTTNHRNITRRSFVRYVIPHKEQVRLALDVGCGQGVALALFKEHAIPAVGITLSEEDVRVCRERGYDVQVGDQSFLDFPDHHFDLVWSRHCLEHSPMPLLTLFEYNRVTREKGFVYVEVPQPDSIHVENPNHYSLFSDRGWRNLFKRAQFALLGYCTYALSYRWPNRLAPKGFMAMDDYYYAYWLQKVEHVRAT